MLETGDVKERVALVTESVASLLAQLSDTRMPPYPRKDRVMRCPRGFAPQLCR